MGKFHLSKIVMILVAIIWIPLALCTTFQVADHWWFSMDKPTDPDIFKNVAANIDWIEAEYADSMPLEINWIESFGLLQRIAGRNYIEDAVPDRSIVKDQNGSLFFTGFWYMPNSFDADPLMAQMAEYRNYLEKSNIPLLYVSPPEKVIDGYTQFPQTINNYSNENVDKMMALCKKYNIDGYDMRKVISEPAKDKTNLFYKTDHHWTTPTAFNGYCELVSYINKHYQLKIDPYNFYRNIDNYDKKVIDYEFIGSQGKRIGKYYTDTDKYTLITPTFKTNMTYQSTKSETDIKTGTFEETLINDKYKNNPTPYTNYYNTYLGGDYAKINITNNYIDNDTKILIIKDSFTNPMAAFLATAVKEVKLVDMRYFTGDLYQETTEFNPDITIIMYSSGSLVKNMYHFNTAMDSVPLKEIPDNRYDQLPKLPDITEVIK